jgi:hypothetical protein
MTPEAPAAVAAGLSGYGRVSATSPARVKDPLHGLRSVSVYGRGEKYVVASESRYYYASFTTSPYFLIPRSASDEKLGGAVIEAINGFTLLAEPLSDEVASAEWAELFATVGVKNRRAFERGASLVHVEALRRKWTIQPWGRQRGHWIPLHENTHVKVSQPSPHQVGGAIRRAFVTIRARP